MTGRTAHETGVLNRPLSDRQLLTHVSIGCCGFNVNVNDAELSGYFNIEAYTLYNLMNVSMSVGAHPLFGPWSRRGLNPVKPVYDPDRRMAGPV